MLTSCRVPIKWTTALLIFLCSWSSIQAKEVHSIEEKNIFHRKKIIFDAQPIKNNTLVYASCDLSVHRHEMNCSVFLESFPTAEKMDRKICNVTYRTSEDRAIDDDFQLKPLYGDRVIFAWTVKQRAEDNSNYWRPPVRKLVYRTVDMSSCKAVEQQIEFEAFVHQHTTASHFLVVPYVDTYDLFYYNASLCGEYMCGQTHDKRGRIINGPVASYMPNKYFQEPGSMFVCPIKPKSSSRGHFLVSTTEFHLVSSYNGEVKHLMNHPKLYGAVANSCDNGYLGFCWFSTVQRELNCSQFNAQGVQVRSQIIRLSEKDSNFNYDLASWLAISNLKSGGMLLLTSKCNDPTGCATLAYTDSISFYVYRVQRDLEGRDTIEFLDEISDVDCRDASRVKMDIHEKDHGEICFTFACHLHHKDEEVEYVNVKAKCISNA